MNQQHRPFFQAVESKLVESGRRTRQAIFAVLLFSFLIGCSSLTPERVNILAQIAGQAAQIGAQQWLKDHPDHRDAFALVLAELQRSLKAGELKQAEVATNLNSLPTATLAGPSGAVYVTEDRLVVWDAELKKAVAVKGAAEQPVIRATVSGLKRAMLPLPPVPVKAKARRVTPTNQVFVHNPPKPLVAATVSIAPVPVQSNAATDGKPKGGWSVYMIGDKPFLAWTNALPVDEPVVFTPAGRTNVTRSVVEVTPNEGAASAVNVRWQLGPRSVYHVEHRNEGGTNWYKFGSLTNISGTGPTNWVGSWHPSMAAGTWRVLRVR